MFLKKAQIFLLLLTVNFVHAEKVNVNETTILVEDTVANDPLKLKQAFAQVLANNTGENILTILKNPFFLETSISKGVKRSYFEKISSKYIGSNQVNNFWFHVVMHEEFIQKVIQQAGFSVLPHNRDKVMLWVVKEEQNTNEQQLQTLSYAKNDEVSAYWLSHWAKALGVNIVLPSLDEVDMLAVSPRSIKSLSFQATEQSKNRYNINHSLLVYIQRKLNSVKIRSGYANQGQDLSIKHFQESSQDQATINEGALYYSVMADIAEKYANAYRINQNDLERHTVQIVLDNIQNYDEINQFEQYISNLSVIDTYSIVAASQGRLVLTANLTITTKAFLKMIARENAITYNQNSPINQLLFSIVKQQEF